MTLFPVVLAALLHRRAFLRLNSGFGLTSKATEWAPEVGTVMSFGRRRSAASGPPW